MKKLLFIVNPRAGRTRSHAPFFDAIARFSQAGYLVRLFITTARGDARQVVSQCGSDYDLIVCAGGDGTLNETISGLMELSQRPPIGYIPHGSTNDFATSLHLSSKVSLAAAAVASGRGHRLDIGRINDRYFSYVASFGAFTRTTYTVPQSAKNALGHLAYILSSINDLDTLRPYRVNIDADGERIHGDFIFGAVCNSTSLGGLVKLDPNRVKMDDGYFELLLLRSPKTPQDLQNLLSTVVKMEYKEPSVIFRHVKKVTLSSPDDLPWSLDGEYFPGAEDIVIDCLPHAITLVK